MAFPPPPPGMIYAYPAPGQGTFDDVAAVLTVVYQILPAFPPYPAPLPAPPASAPRPKRKQVKMAVRTIPL